MSRPLLYAIVFIEGFCSLGAEIIALRQIIPHIGSSIVVTAPTIGLFLLALALGYQAGGRVAGRYLDIVARNFLIAAALCGAGLAGESVDRIFALSASSAVGYLVFIGGILCPLAWLLGQTVPILTNLMKSARTGEASGYALYYSTLGSFLGSLTLSLFVMQWLGISAAIGICTLLLLAGFLLLGRRNWRPALAAAAILALTFGANAGRRPIVETAYANYEIVPLNFPGRGDAIGFKSNNSLASLLYTGEPPRYARYIERLRHILLDELSFRGRSILVLGAGGFTLSHREPENRYTYVDIDPAIREIAERRFLHEPIRGEFIADDARRYVATSEVRYDAVVVDVYSSHTAIPGHLVTQEFWRGTRRVLTPDGTMIANLILDSRLDSPYARNLLATIESVYGRCAVELLHREQPAGNVLVSCRNGASADAPKLYIDERNQADFDRARAD